MAVQLTEQQEQALDTTQLALLQGTELDALLAEIKARIGDQLTEIGGLNGRASSGLASGSILTALTSLLGAAQKSGVLSSWGLPLQALTVLALLAYVAVVVSTFRAYAIKAFETGEAPRPLLRTYSQDKPGTNPPRRWQTDEIKRDLAARLVHGYVENDDKIVKKRYWTQAVFWSLVAQAALLFVITLVELFLPPAKS